MPVDLCLLYRHKNLYAEIIVMLYNMWRFKSFELIEHDIQLLMVAQIKMSIQQVVHSFDIVTGFHVNHLRIFFEQVNPFLRVLVILDKILPDESVPSIALVQVEPFVKAGLFHSVGWQVLFKELFYTSLIFFIACMSIFHIPTV